MKKLFSLALLTLMMVTGKTFAQSSVLATLSHEGQISTFYGAGALKSAHEAAAHGDVITLSSGSFQAVNITKALTIRGAGMQTDSVAKIYPSVIVGSFYIDVADSLEQRLTVEGVYCDDNTVTVYNTLSNATFIKSRFYSFSSVDGSAKGYGYMKNLAFIHCRIGFSFSNENVGNSVSFVNSVVVNPIVGSNGYANNSFEFTNSVVSWWNTTPYDNSYYAIYRNCILTTTDSRSNYLSATNLIYNCLGVASRNMFYEHGSLASSLYYTTTELTNVFKTWGGRYSDAENFELTDTAKSNYLGDDGKEVGIYGGNLPYTPNPTNPKITKFNVASKSTADGKLSVDIEVKAAE
ncbi:MAG: hypothetical protein IJ699_01275 [Bacteroidaceae bacterium]|nr:hypothetical protein [Bacteroidaceae bacterium]